MAPINDQASALRSAVNQKRSLQARKSLCCFAVASGKGGVGKTFLCVNLAVAISALNKKTLIIDADLGLANADIAFGVDPSYSLQDAIFKGKALRDVVTRTPYGVDLLAASSGAREMVSLGQARLKLLIEELVSFAAEYDALIFDCAAGIDHNVTSFLGAVPQTVVVAAPQPASIMDAYALTKVIHQENLSKHISLVVNMATSEAEGERVRQTLDTVSKNYLSRDLDVLGVVPSTPGALAAIRARQPLVKRSPDDPAARAIREIAKKMVTRRTADTRLGDLDAQRLIAGLVKS